MFDDKQFRRVRSAIVFLSLLAWGAILAGTGGACHCSVGAGASWREILKSNPPAELAQGWAVMLVAMMAPMLISPIYFIRATSFARTRARLVTLFVAGYILVWMAVGLLFAAVELGTKLLWPRSAWPALLTALAAFVWQFSPGKQICLNRCHSHPPLAAFGLTACLNAWRMGLEHGAWCVGSCWAMMLFPMLLPTGHNLAMIAVGVVMVCERLDPAAAPSWRWRGLGTALRLVYHTFQCLRRHLMPSSQVQTS